MYRLDGKRRTPYVPHLQKQLNQKQRWSARAEMRKTGSACKEAMAAVASSPAASQFAYELTYQSRDHQLGKRGELSAACQHVAPHRGRAPIW